MCFSYTNSFVLNRLSVIPLLYIDLINLERAQFQFLWCKRAPMVLREIFFFFPSENYRGELKVEIRQHTLRLCFLGRMFAQHDNDGNFWTEDAKAFPSLQNVLLDDGEVRRLPRNECSYRECRQALRIFQCLRPFYRNPSHCSGGCSRRLSG